GAAETRSAAWTTARPAAAKTRTATEETTRAAPAKTWAATEETTRTPAAKTRTAAEGTTPAAPAKTQTATAGETRTATAGLVRNATPEAWAAVAERRTSAAKRWAAPAGRTRPPTAQLAARRDPAPRGSPRSATVRSSRRCRRRRRTGPAPPAEAAHTTGTSEPRSLPNPPHPDGSMLCRARHRCRCHQPPKSPSVQAPGDHSPPEQDSPLEQELNGVPDGQQRIRSGGNYRPAGCPDGILGQHARPQKTTAN